MHSGEANWSDPVAFARERLGFEPEEHQARVLQGARRAILNCTRQWGKSTVSAAMAVHRAYTQPESLIVVVSAAGRQSGEFLLKARTFARQLGMQPKGDGHNEMSILFPNGSRIVGLPDSEDTIRGFSKVSLLLIDEASRVSDETYHAVRPMLAVSNGDLWLMSTPKGRRGFFFTEWTAGTEKWERVLVTAPACPRIPADFLEAERAKRGDWYYRQEYLCEFVDGEDALFSKESLDRAMRGDFGPLGE
ncbi:MAG: terminase family protein [Bryobacteraceae bacterium]